MVRLARMALWKLIQHGGEKVDNSKWFRKLLLIRGKAALSQRMKEQAAISELLIPSASLGAKR